MRADKHLSLTKNLRAPEPTINLRQLCSLRAKRGINTLVGEADHLIDHPYCTMKYWSSIALVAGFASDRPQYARSEVVSFDHNSLRNGVTDRHLQEPMDMTNSVTEGPVTLQQLELIQTIIRELSKAELPDGVDLSKVNVAVIITEVLQELGIDASVSGGDLSEVDMDLIIQEIIEKAAEKLGVVITTTTTTLPTTTTVAESCSVCGDGMKVGNPLGNLALPGQPEVACGALETAGANGVIPSAQCAFLPGLIADVCECIPSDSSTTTVAPETTTTTTPDATTDSSTTTVAPETTTTTTPDATTIPSCVCSALSYTFTINLSQNCDTNDFQDGPGIGNTICLILPSTNEDEIDFDTLKVFDVQFLEIDTSGNLTVITQDDTYTNVSLSSGDIISFNSASAELNPDEPLSSQLNHVPGGVLMTLRAKSEGSSTIWQNRVSWTYTNSCESLPTSVGDAIGWITLVSDAQLGLYAISFSRFEWLTFSISISTLLQSDQTEASQAFCPVATTPSPTKAPVTASPTAAPVAPTDTPTFSPTKSPTPAPVAATDSPTTSPTKSPTLSPVPDPTKEPTLAPITPTPTKAKMPTTAPTASPTTFGKATKSKSGKGTKNSKSDPLAKTIKEVTGKGTKSSKSDPLAKVIKQEDDASMPAFAKTTKTEQQQISSKAGSYLISKGNKSQKELSLPSKLKQPKSSKASADAKAHKNSSKATQQVAAQSMSMN
jgi:hypothetical protein